MKILPKTSWSLVMASAVAALLVGCGQDEVMWETTTGAVGVNAADQETLDTEWREYRVATAAALDEMKRSLDAARRKGSVADRAEIEGLVGRIDGLRAAMLAEMDVPKASDAQRASLRDDFDGVQRDVMALLGRLEPSQG